MTGKGSKRRPRTKDGKHGALFLPLAFITTCVALIFAMSVFFRVSDVEVTGNSYYTSDEVIEAAGIDTGDNLFFINRFGVVSRIFSKLPYVETAVVTRYLPDRIVVEISESMAIAYVTVEGQPWVIDRTCKVLRLAETADMDTLIRISGLTPVDPTVGEIVVPSEGDELKVEYLTDILDQIQRRGLTGSVTGVNIDSVVGPYFDYIGRFTVKLGSSEDTEYKFGKLLGAVELLAEGDRGIIDLSVSGDKALFTPE